MANSMSDPLKEVKLYAGGRAPRKGRHDGRWYCHLRYGVYNSRGLFGDNPSHSERRLELMGIIAGLKALKYPCVVEVRTPTEYVVDCGDRLLRGKSTDLFVGAVYKGSAKNADLWQQVKELSKTHRIWITEVKITALRRELAAAEYQAAQGVIRLTDHVDVPQ